MISSSQSMLHLATAAALVAGLIGAGVGAIARPAGERRAVARPACLVGGLVGAAMTFAVAQREFGPIVSGGAAIAAWALALGLAIGLGVGGIVVGLRGRWVGDHEHCRRCGFDLFGRPDGTRLCNECGAPLDAPRAIVVGVRHRRPVPLLTGTFVAVLAVSIGGVVARDAIQQPGGFDWIRYKPTAWLIDDVAALKRPVRLGVATTAAEAELARRLAAGELSARDGERIAAAAIAGTPASPIDFVALDAWSRGLVAEPTARALVALRARPTVTIDPVSRPERVGYSITMGRLDALLIAAIACGQQLLWTVEVKDRADAIDGNPVGEEPLEHAARGPGTPPIVARSHAYERRDPFGRHLIPQTLLNAGPCVVRLKLTATVTLHVLGGNPIVVDVPIDVTGRTTVVK